MTKATQDKGGSKAQFARFVETARVLGCDEDKERFESKLGKIAAQKPARDKETSLKKSGIGKSKKAAGSD